jgi:hypothetical protein
MHFLYIKEFISRREKTLPVRPLRVMLIPTRALLNLVFTVKTYFYFLHFDGSLCRAVIFATGP